MLIKLKKYCIDILQNSLFELNIIEAEGKKREYKQDARARCVNVDGNIDRNQECLFSHSARRKIFHSPKRSHYGSLSLSPMIFSGENFLDDSLTKNVLIANLRKAHDTLLQRNNLYSPLKKCQTVSRRKCRANRIFPSLGIFLEILSSLGFRMHIE